MSNFARVTRGDGFSKDLKKLIKRFRSLEEDLEIFIKAQLFAYHKLQIDNHGLFPINNLSFESPQVKAKKFACKSLKGKGQKVASVLFMLTYLKTRNFSTDSAGIGRKLVDKYTNCCN